MALTDSIYVVGTAVYTLLDSRKVDLGLQDVWYGDQDKTPRTPCVAVETGPKIRTLNGAPRRTQVDMDVYLLVYHEMIRDTQENQRASEQLSEAIEAVLHEDPTLGGILIHSMVTLNEPGYATRGGALIRASRMTFSCLSQVLLPYSV